MKTKFKNICGVVLAGGKCSRYEGENKAFLKIEKETFYDKTTHLLANIFDEVIVITNSTDGFPVDNIPKYKDIIKDIGPLGGIHTALTNAKGVEAIFIVAVDMPFLNGDIIREMTTTFNRQKMDILIPKVGHHIEPLSAIYSVNILEKLSEYLNTTSNYSIRSFFKKVDTKFFELKGTFINKKSFFNINSQDDYDAHINESNS